MKNFIHLINLITITCYSLPQTDSLPFFKPSATINKKRLTAVIASEATIYSISMAGLYQLWYKDYPRSSFHFFNDNNEWLQMDKIGHAVTSYYVGRAGIGALKWSGVNNKKAIGYGGTLGSLFLTTVEILDGFSSQWGASFGDILANTAGTGLLIGQELLWKEQRMLLKFSVHTTQYAPFRPALLGSTTTEQIFKDYNGHTYWLSANIGSFLHTQTRFPSWLNIAFGYSAEGMLGGDNNPSKDENGNTLPHFKRARQYYLSLDVDLTKIKTRSNSINILLQTFGFIKFPAPAIEISNGKIRMKGFYF